MKSKSSVSQNGTCEKTGLKASRFHAPTDPKSVAPPETWKNVSKGMMSGAAGTVNALTSKRQLALDEVADRTPGVDLRTPVQPEVEVAGVDEGRADRERQRGIWRQLGEALRLGQQGDPADRSLGQVAVAERRVGAGPVRHAVRRRRDLPGGDAVRRQRRAVEIDDVRVAEGEPEVVQLVEWPSHLEVGVQLDQIQRVAAVLAEGPLADRLASSQRRTRVVVVPSGSVVVAAGSEVVGAGSLVEGADGSDVGTLPGAVVAGTGTTTLVAGAGPLVGGMVVLVGADSARGMQATSTAPSRAAIQTRGENPPRRGRFERRVGFTAVAP